jgi:predicted Zn-dependent protease/predicted Ser/Thr protein kinase
MIGRTVSHYRILSELGSGGMGVVYRAEDLTLGRHVAVKFLSAQLNTDPDARRRFIHEAKAAAALDHSGICTVYDTGEADGAPFIAMAFIEGETLRDRIVRGPLPLAEALGIALQVAEALQEAHAKGVVHRDVKPANIMLTPKGQAKVMDFGLAQLAGASQLTRSGTTLGTAAYISPEQARGEEADGRTDLWSLGVVLYELVCGRRPFQGEHEGALYHNLMHGEPTPLTALRTGVPIELDRIVGKCLAKDAGRRYQHADELAVDLRRLRGVLDETQSLAPVSAPRRSVTVPKRTVVLLLILAVAVAGSWALWRVGRTPPPAENVLAVVDFEDLGGAADSLSAAGLGGLLQVGLVERCPVRVVSPEYLQDLRRRLFAGSEGPIRADQALAVARKAGATLLLSGQVGRRGGAQFAVWRLVETGQGRGVGGQRVVQEDLVALADGIIAEVVPLIASRAKVVAAADTGSVGRITTSSPEAYRHFVAGELALNGHTRNAEAARRHFEAAVRLDSLFALSWMRLADFHWSATDIGPARVYADRAWALRSRLGVKDRLMLESRRMQLNGSDPSAALDVYREMLQRWPDDRTILRSYGEALQWWWMFREAQALAEQGLARYPDDEALGATLCSVLVTRGRTTEAKVATLDYLRRHPGSMRGWDLLGIAELAAGEADSAEAAFRRARSLDPDDVVMQGDLARCAIVRGHVDEAETIVRNLLARSDLSSLQRAQLMTGWRDPGMATLCAESGRLREALDWTDEAASLVERGGAESWVALITRMRILNDARRWPEALALAGTTPLTAAWGAAWRMKAFVQADSLPEARRMLARFRAVPNRSVALAHYVPLSTAASLALAEGHPDSALAALAELMEYQRLEPTEVELRAQAQRELGRLEDAAATLEDLLRRRGSRFLARYEVGRIYEEMGRGPDARRQYEIFLEGWKHADPGWPQVADARRRLAALRAGG